MIGIRIGDRSTKIHLASPRVSRGKSRVAPCSRGIISGCARNRGLARECKPHSRERRGAKVTTESNSIPEVASILFAAFLYLYANVLLETRKFDRRRATEPIDSAIEYAIVNDVGSIPPVFTPEPLKAPARISVLTDVDRFFDGPE